MVSIFSRYVCWGGGLFPRVMIRKWHGICDMSVEWRSWEMIEETGGGVVGSYIDEEEFRRLRD